MRFTAQAPTRLSLFCGGTDLPPFCNEYGGRAINVAINIRQNAELSILEGGLSYLSILGNVLTIDLRKILPHGNKDLDLVFGVIDYFKPRENFYLSSDFEHITGAGLGSSGSAGVMLVALFNKWLNRGFSPKEIVEIAWRIETKHLGRTGCQDQIAAVYGGINNITIKNISDSNFNVNSEELVPKSDNLRDHLMLFYSGGQRSSAEVQKGLKSDKYLKSMLAVTDEAEIKIYNGDFKGAGKMLNRMWELKKRVNNVTNQQIDKAYYLAMEAGAWGGKLIGAGQSGHMIFIAGPGKQGKIREALVGFEEIDFDFDYNGVEVRRT